MESSEYTVPLHIFSLNHAYVLDSMVDLLSEMWMSPAKCQKNTENQVFNWFGSSKLVDSIFRFPTKDNWHKNWSARNISSPKSSHNIFPFRAGFFVPHFVLGRLRSWLANSFCWDLDRINMYYVSISNPKCESVDTIWQKSDRNNRHAFVMVKKCLSDSLWKRVTMTDS